MTEIRVFIDKIIAKPAFLIDVDWLEETNCFDEYRIKDIIMNIADDQICGMIKNYIITCWYDTCELILSGKDDFDELVHKRFWDTSGEWKFVPIEDDEDYEYELQCIEDYIEKILKARSNALRRKAKKQELDAKANEREMILKKNNQIDDDFNPCINNDLFSSHYYQEYKRLLKENECLKRKLEKYNNDKQYVIDHAKMDGIRTVVEQLIIYGEKFPSNQNDKAGIIKEALLAKSFNGHIPSNVLTSEWKTRLVNLGRKETIGMQVGEIHAEKLYDVHDNREVKL